MTTWFTRQYHSFWIPGVDATQSSVSYIYPAVKINVGYSVSEDNMLFGLSSIFTP